MTLPVLFISHGAPNLYLSTQMTAYKFLNSMNSNYLADVQDKIKSILVISAHWEERVPMITDALNPKQFYDFYGFEPDCYSFKYPAKGDAKLVDRVEQILLNSGDSLFKKVERSKERGLDHGAWSPLAIMFPEANIPIVQLSLVSPIQPEMHIRLGKLLQPLRDEGVLIVASGGAVHNLGDLGWGNPEGKNPKNWAKEFDQYLEQVLTKDRIGWIG
jgi:4,5-DOPA dioxygenase extradiol